MPPARRRPARLALAAALAAAAAAALLALPGARPGDRAPPGTTAAPFLPRACVTRHGACPVGPVWAGGPCRCPHPLRGSVPGHVEVVGAPPVRAGSRDWSSREAQGDRDDPLAGLGPLQGP